MHPRTVRQISTQRYTVPMDTIHLVDNVPKAIRRDILDARQDMTKFWEDRGQDATIEEMMLDNNAAELTKLELPEILSYLPPCDGFDILELGAGIGRFTCHLSGMCNHVLAVDFMEKFIQKNKETNGQLPNVDFMCADATKLELPKNSYNMIFSNWLMMYLDDDECQSLIKNQLSWVRENGYVFARESCITPASNKVMHIWKNPTKYRDPHLYDEFFDGISIPSNKENECFVLDRIWCKPLQSYIKVRNNKNQMVWLLQKTRRTYKSDYFNTSAELFERHQYSRNKILKLEMVFGKAFTCVGGYATTKELLAGLELRQTQVVLDVGCGIGGSAFYMVKEFGVKVVAIDMSLNMVNIASERAQEVGVTEEDVKFEITDVTNKEFPPAIFDVVHSRDSTICVQNKLLLFQKFFKWLKPGGKLLLSDFCCSTERQSGEFMTNAKQMGCNMMTPEGYGKILKDAGFSNIQVNDWTELFLNSLQKDLQRTTEVREDFIKEFSQKDFDLIVGGLKDRIQGAEKGDQKWGVFYAEKL